EGPARPAGRFESVALALRRLANRHLGAVEPGAVRLRLLARLGGSGEKVVEPVALGEATRCRRRRTGLGDEAVPTPYRTIGRDERLARLQLPAEALAVRFRHEADLG